MGKKEDPMSPHFALFNLHVNDAQKKADRAFVQRYGQEKFDEIMKPLHEDGIMGIFQTKPTEELKFYLNAVFCFVNEKARKTSKLAENDPE